LCGLGGIGLTHHGEHERGGAVEFSVHFVDHGEVVKVVEGQIGMEDVERGKELVGHAEVDLKEILELEFGVGGWRGGVSGKMWRLVDARGVAEIAG